MKSGQSHEKSGHRGKATRTHSQGYGTLGDSLLEPTTEKPQELRVPAEGRQHKSASGLNGPSRMESGEPNKVPKIRSQGCRTLGVLAGALG